MDNELPVESPVSTSLGGGDGSVTDEPSTFYSTSKFDKNLFDYEIKKYIEKEIAKEELFQTNINLLRWKFEENCHYEIPNMFGNVLPIISLPNDKIEYLDGPEEMFEEETIGEIEGKKINYELQYNGITKNRIVASDMKLEPIYKTVVSWGRWTHINNFIPTRLKDKYLELCDKASKLGLPYNVKAFPDSAVDWANRLKKFFSPNARVTMKNHNIAQQLGIILSGPPGTGKTLFVNFLSDKLGLTVTKLLPTELTAAAERGMALPNHHIVILDDVEELLIERKDDNSTFVLPWLLSQTDAHDVSVRRLLVLVTNHIEKIDDALMRPGRFDSIIKFDPPTKTQIREMLIHHCGNESDNIDELCKSIIGVQSLAHISLMARMVYSGFVDSWEEAISKIKDDSGYKGIKIQGNVSDFNN